MAQTTIQLLGHEVSIAEDGLQAVELFQRQRPRDSRERDLIRNEGLEEFDRLDQDAELSLVDVRRPPLVR